MEQHFPEFLEKKTTFARYSCISQLLWNFIKVVSIPFDFNLEFPKFTVECFAFQKFNYFRIFCKTFPENFRTICPCFKNFGILIEWKVPYVNTVEHRFKIKCINKCHLLHLFCFFWLPILYKNKTNGKTIRKLLEKILSQFKNKENSGDQNVTPNNFPQGINK